MLALAGMFVASTVAIFQTDLKRLFAYSSVAQIGYIMLGLSFNSHRPDRDHRAPVQPRRDQGRDVHAARRRGHGRWAVPAWSASQGLAGACRSPASASCSAGLSLIGVPGTAGFVSKWYLILAALEKGQWWLVFLIVASSLLAVAYVWRFVEAAYFREPRRDSAADAKVPLSMAVPAGLLVPAAIGLRPRHRVHRRLGRAGSDAPAGRTPLMDSAGQTVALALLVPAAGAVLIACAGRLPNLREAITLAHRGRAAHLRAHAAAGGASAARARTVAVHDAARAAARLQGRAAGHAVRARRLRPVDRQLALLDRLHARQRGGAPDALLRLLRARARLRRWASPSRQPVHAVPLLRSC